MRLTWALAALAIFGLGIAIEGRVLAGNSVGYRGVDTSGRYEDSGLLKKWPDHGPRLPWKAFGGGWAGPLVQDGRVYAIGGNPARLHVYSPDGEQLLLSKAPDSKRAA